MPQRDPFLAALEEVRQAPPPDFQVEVTASDGLVDDTEDDPFLAALDEVRSGVEFPPSRIDAQREWSMSPARDRAAQRMGQAPAPLEPTRDTRSSLARGYDWATTPLVSDTTARGLSGAIAGQSGPVVPLPERSITERLGDAWSAIPDVASNLLEQPIATIRGGLGGMVEGGAQALTSPMDLASFATLGIGRAARPLLGPAVNAIRNLEDAVINARKVGNLDEVARLAGEMNDARQRVGQVNALVGTINAVDRTAAGMLTARGVERWAQAKELSDMAAGIAETALGAAGLRSAPMPRSTRPSLNAAQGYVVDPAGRTVPTIEADKIVAPPVDPSFVRSEPAEYARREVRGLLQPARGFAVDTAGRAVPVAEAAALQAPLPRGARPISAADPSAVTSQRAAIAGREFDGRKVARKVFSGDPNAVDVPLIDLSPDDIQGLRWLREELDNIQFTARGFQDAGARRGGDLEVIPGGAGSPILEDLQQARGSSGSRSDFIHAIDKLLGGEQAALGQDALIIARRLMGGDAALRRKMLLPPDAGLPRQADDLLSQADTAIADDSSDPFVHALDDVRGGAGESVQPQAASAIDDFDQFDRMLGDDVDPADLDPGEFGGVAPMLAARSGGAIAGAAYGAATGEDTEDRIQRGLAFGVGGAIAPSLLTRPAAAGGAARIGAHRRESFGRVGPLDTSARGVPRATAIPKSRLMEFPSLEKQPEDVRSEIAGLLEKHGGFAAQRRNVQPIARTEALSEGIRLPLETLKPGTALNAEELAAYRDAVASVMAKRQPLVSKIESGAATDIDKLEFSRLTDEAVVFVASFRGAKAEAGRALNILRSKARVLELGDAKLIEQAIKAPGFDGNVKDLSAAIAAAGNNPEKQLELLRRYAGGSFFDKATAAYYNGLLSGVKAHVRNLIGNTSNLLANIANPIGAAPVEAVRSRLQGRPAEVYLREIPESVAATFMALPQAFRDFSYTMRHGFTPLTVERAAAGKFDTPRVELPGGLVTNWPARALEASDAAFRRLAFTQELYAGALAQARKEGITKPLKLRERIAELTAGTSQLSEDLRTRAEVFSVRATFQEETGPFLRQLMGLKNSKAMPAPVRAAVTFIAPFMRTPGNILRQGAEYSPLGLGMKAIRQEGREGAQAAGRVVIGSAVLLPMAYLALNNRLSGAGPQDSGERAALMEKGWRPNSIKVGNTWVGYQQLQPYSVPLAAVANGFEKFMKSDRTDHAAEESFTRAMAAVGTSFLDQSFLSGLSDFLDAVSDPDRSAPQFLSRFSQGLVPGSGLLRNVAQAVDPVVRKPEGVGESIKTIIPGLSKTVPPRRDRQGRVIERPGGPLRRGFMAPDISEEVTDDPVAALWERVGLKPDVPRATLQMNDTNVPLTRAQANLLQQARGEARTRALLPYARSTRFAALDVDTQRNVVERATADATRAVTERAQRLMRRRQPFTLNALLPAETP